MADRGSRKDSPPTFASIAEEAEFWDTHSPLDYPEEWIELDEEPTETETPPGHILAVRLDAAIIEKLATIGRLRGIGPSSLARQWLIERLTEWTAERDP